MATADLHVKTDAHHDDHDHEHEHHGNFWTNYVFSQDHKVIAKQFLITGMAWALIGGILSVSSVCNSDFLTQALNGFVRSWEDGLPRTAKSTQNFIWRW